MFAACTDRRDNDIDIKKQNVYVKYKLEVGSALASLYDIEITYCSISGKEYTEDFKLRRTGNKWEYKEEAGNDANIHFKFVATARLKEKYELEDEEYNLSRTFSVNWYEQAKYVYETEHVIGSSVILVSEAVWQQLSEEELGAIAGGGGWSNENPCKGKMDTNY